MYIYIRSMSEQQSRIYDKIVDRSEQIDLHIMKLLLFPNSQYVDHWMHEIWSFLFRIDRLKGSNKWPKASFIQKCLSTHNDTIEQFLDVAISSEENLEPRYVSIDEARRALVKYQTWLADELSKNGSIRQPDAKAKLNEILREHCEKIY